MNRGVGARRPGPPGFGGTLTTPARGRGPDAGATARGPHRADVHTTEITRCENTTPDRGPSTARRLERPHPRRGQRPTGDPEERSRETVAGGLQTHRTTTRPDPAERAPKQKQPAEGAGM